MSDKKQFSGWIRVLDHGESNDVLFVGADDEPFADTLDFMNRENVTVRYWVTDCACAIEQASEEFLKTVMGCAEVEFNARYSEITGYLWTDEELNVGGHDLLNELKSYDCSFLNLEVEVH